MKKSKKKGSKLIKPLKIMTGDNTNFTELPLLLKNTYGLETSKVFFCCI
jgi:hypothetical protein